jgi:hypothetical protein
MEHGSVPVAIRVPWLRPWPRQHAFGAGASAPPYSADSPQSNKASGRRRQLERRRQNNTVGGKVGIHQLGAVIRAVFAGAGVNSKGRKRERTRWVVMRFEGQWPFFFSCEPPKGEKSAWYDSSAKGLGEQVPPGLQGLTKHVGGFSSFDSHHLYF